jgi:hypothetical protein
MRRSFKYDQVPDIKIAALVIGCHDDGRSVAAVIEIRIAVAHSDLFGVRSLHDATRSNIDSEHWYISRRVSSNVFGPAISELGPALSLGFPLLGNGRTQFSIPKK